MTEGEVTGENIVLTAEDVSTYSKFKSIIGNTSDILHLIVVTSNSRNDRPIEKVTCCIEVELRSNGQTAVEERDIESEVACNSCLPFNLLVREHIRCAVIQLTISSGLTEARATGT